MAQSGQTDRARQILRKLLEHSEPAPTRPYFLAALHAVLGENDLAFSALERAFAERDMWLMFLPSKHVAAGVGSLQSDPRWPDFVARVAAARRL